MGILPEPIEELINVALVGELTVLDPSGSPVTYPLIPLYDGERVYMTSSVLFSKKLEHIKNDPRVSVTISDPIAAQIEPFRRATIQGTARIVEDDLHSGWERVLPMWTAKEPIIEITPTRAFLWAGGDTSQPAEVFELAGAAA